MPTLPSVPTDSLYKFVALFGLVVLGFGLWYPEQRIREADAGIRETAKDIELSQIKLKRKTERAHKVLDEVNSRSAELREKRGPLEEALAALQSKRNALLRDLDALLTNGKGNVADATKRAEVIKSEGDALMASMRETKDQLDKLNADYKTVTVQQEDLSDELETETVRLKASIGIMTDLRSHSDIWFNHMLSSIYFGWGMILLGFGFWYFRIQRHQDSILRQRAKNLTRLAKQASPQQEAEEVRHEFPKSQKGQP